jgi:membrane protein
LNKKLVGRELRELIIDTLGKDGAAQVTQTARGFNTLASNWYIAIGGFLFLVFVATTLFSVIKNSLNEIWNIDVKEKPGILFNLKLRARSFAIIMAAGILFLAGIVIDSFELIAGNYMQSIWSHAGVYFRGALNEIVGVVIVTAWFIVLFRYLADGRPSWRVTIAGGCLTGILFSAGKEIISLVMRNSNLNSLYGASASIVLILLFVFYSSFILYYGASFIKVYSEQRKEPHRLISKAYRYKVEAIPDHEQ